MVNQEAKYHNNCLIDLYKRANAAQLHGSFTESERQLHRIAFSELVTYIEEMVTHSSDKKFVFKLSDLIKLYSQSLETLGITLQNKIHSTRLKNCILSQFPDMNCFPDEREVIMAFNDDIGQVLSSSVSTNYDNEGYILAEAAKIVRRDMLKTTQQPFSGGFAENCQEHYVPSSLKAMVTMILRGSNIDRVDNPYFNQATLTISQLMIFNSTLRTRQTSS